MTKMMMKIMIMMNEDFEEENQKKIKNMKISQKNVNIKNNIKKIYVVNYLNF